MALAGGIVFLLDALLIQVPVVDHYDLRLREHFLTLVGSRGHHLLSAFTLNDAGHHKLLLFGLAIAGASLVLCGWFLRVGAINDALLLAVSVLSVATLELFLKSIIPVPGPEIDNGNNVFRTFPSGHTAVGVTLYVSAAYLLSRRLEGKARTVSIAVAVTLAVVTTLSALTFHFPSEVLGGLALSAVCLGLLAPLSERMSDPRPGDSTSEIMLGVLNSSPALHHGAPLTAATTRDKARRRDAPSREPRTEDG